MKQRPPAAIASLLALIAIFLLTSCSPAPATEPAPPPPAPPASTPPASGDLKITRAPGTVRRGNTATVAAQTAPGTRCTITVTYKSGPTSAAGLEPKAAGTDGSITWSWTVGSNTTQGTWPVKITCGQRSVETSVTVQ